MQNLVRYAAGGDVEDLSPVSRTQLQIHILDSLGCCIAALGEAPIQACRQQVTDFGGTGPCALIGGGEATPVYAAFWHTALVLASARVHSNCTTPRSRVSPPDRSDRTALISDGELAGLGAVGRRLRTLDRGAAAVKGSKERDD